MFLFDEFQWIFVTVYKLFWNSNFWRKFELIMNISNVLPKFFIFLTRKMIRNCLLYWSDVRATTFCKLLLTTLVAAIKIFIDFYWWTHITSKRLVLMQGQFWLFLVWFMSEYNKILTEFPLSHIFCSSSLDCKSTFKIVGLKS